MRTEQVSKEQSLFKSIIYCLYAVVFQKQLCEIYGCLILHGCLNATIFQSYFDIIFKNTIYIELKYKVSHFHVQTIMSNIIILFGYAYVYYLSDSQALAFVQCFPFSLAYSQFLQKTFKNIFIFSPLLFCYCVSALLSFHSQILYLQVFINM